MRRIAILLLTCAVTVLAPSAAHAAALPTTGTHTYLPSTQNDYVLAYVHGTASTVPAFAYTAGGWSATSFVAGTRVWTYPMSGAPAWRWVWFKSAWYGIKTGNLAQDSCTKTPIAANPLTEKTWRILGRSTASVELFSRNSAYSLIGNYDISAYNAVATCSNGLADAAGGTAVWVRVSIHDPIGGARHDGFMRASDIRLATAAIKNPPTVTYTMPAGGTKSLKAAANTAKVATWNYTCGDATITQTTKITFGTVNGNLGYVSQVLDSYKVVTPWGPTGGKWKMATSKSLATTSYNPASKTFAADGSNTTRNDQTADAAGKFTVTGYVRYETRTSFRYTAGSPLVVTTRPVDLIRVSDGKPICDITGSHRASITAA